jgi:hypothetical protein
MTARSLCRNLHGLRGCSVINPWARISTTSAGWNGSVNHVVKAFLSTPPAPTPELASHRDLFIEDHDCSKEKWDRIIAKSPNHFKHPTSSHIVSDYARLKYEKGNYNFNVIGEFSLGISAIFNYQKGASASQNTQPQQRHRAIVWPDGLIFENLEKEDVNKLMVLCMSEKRIQQEDLRTAALSTAVKVEFVNFHHIFSAYNQYTSASYAQKTLDWFVDSCGGKMPSNYHMYLASTMEGHRTSTSLLVLPSNDSFSYVGSKSKVESIVSGLDNLKC